MLTLIIIIIVVVNDKVSFTCLADNINILLDLLQFLPLYHVYF